MPAAKYVDRHRVPGNSPVVSVFRLRLVDEREMIILFHVGFPPDNAISNGLQGESITKSKPILVSLLSLRPIWDIRDFEYKCFFLLPVLIGTCRWTLNNNAINLFYNFRWYTDIRPREDVVFQVHKHSEQLVIICSR